MRFNEVLNLRNGEYVYIIGYYYANGEAAHVRINGQVKTWKREPNRIKIPFKYGIYDHGYITEDNLNKFTLVKPESIPKNQVKEINANFRGV